MRRRERPDEIYVYVCKSPKGNRDLLRAEVDVSEDLAMLTGKTGPTPISNVTG